MPPEEKGYLKVMFQILDQAVAVRVAGLQNFANQRFNLQDTDAEFNQLIIFVKAMPVLKTLTAYHAQILAGLDGERQFFQDWNRERNQFAYSQ